MEEIKDISKRLFPEKLSLGKLVHEIIANDRWLNDKEIQSKEVRLASIEGLRGIAQLSDYTRIMKERQDNLYKELDKREEKYQKR